MNTSKAVIQHGLSRNETGNGRGRPRHSQKGRARRGEQGEARPGNSARRGGPQLQLSRGQLETWSKSDPSAALVQGPTKSYMFLQDVPSECRLHPQIGHCCKAGRSTADNAILVTKQTRGSSECITMETPPLVRIPLISAVKFVLSRLCPALAGQPPKRKGLPSVSGFGGSSVIRILYTTPRNCLEQYGTWCRVAVARCLTALRYCLLCFFSCCTTAVQYSWAAIGVRGFGG